MQIDQWIDYEFPTTVQSALTGCWIKYKGQTQKWGAHDLPSSSKQKQDANALSDYSSAVPIHVHNSCLAL